MSAPNHARRQGVSETWPAPCAQLLLYEGDILTRYVACIQTGQKGQVYYWNTKTNKTTWNKPGSMVSVLAMDYRYASARAMLLWWCSGARRVPQLLNGGLGLILKDEMAVDVDCWCFLVVGSRKMLRRRGGVC